MKSMRAVALAGVLLAVGTTGHAAGKDTLPNGRPFQMLQQQIADLDAALAQQIADLEAQLAALESRVDAIEQHDAVQDQLIGAVQAAIGMLEQRMTAAEADIDALQTWNALQDAVLAQLNARVNSLQSQVNAQGAQFSSQINTLFNLHNQQAILIGQLQNAINFLTSQNNAQQSQINSLQAQLNAVNAAYNNTRNQLAAGCAPGSSIRQLIPNGPVLCEQDTGQVFTTTQASAFSGSFPPGAIVSATAVCPPVGPPPPGQPASPQFAATGGGYSIPPVGALVVASQAASPNSWRVTVRNTNLPPFGSSISFTALAHCYRNVP